MPLSLLLPLYVASAGLASATSAQLATMESLNGEWGFVEWDHPNRDLLREPGKCGEPNTLVISIDREAEPDGTLEWILRLNPHQQFGGLVTNVESTADAQRVTVEFFGPIEPDVDFFEIADDRLTLVRGTVHTQFVRCRA